MHGSYSAGVNGGNLVNAIIGQKPVLSGGLAQDVGKGIDYATGSQIFETLGSVIDFPIGFIGPNAAAKLPNWFLKNRKALEGAQTVLGWISDAGDKAEEIQKFMDELNRRLAGEGKRVVAVRGADGSVVFVVQSVDPNDIIGPAGVGDGNFTRKDLRYPYTIRFENLDTATAPAQEVRITQHLDEDLDLDTFELGSFGFGDLQFVIPERLQEFETQIDLIATQGLILDVRASLNRDTRTHPMGTPLYRSRNR